MSITISLSSCEIEHDSMEAEYGDDILYAGWNPEVDSVSQQLQLEPTTEQRDMSVAPKTKVAELFLRKMYSFQR
ncbi:MAG: hypothetical protein WCA63_08420 [Gallionella sp.]